MKTNSNKPRAAKKASPKLPTAKKQNQVQLSAKQTTQGIRLTIISI